MKALSLRLILIAFALVLGGCASVDGSVDSGRSMKKVQRFFIVSNLNDNRALDRQIAAALRAAGRTAEVGPLTMMPEDTQAVLSFQDHWTWDFGEHLVYLRIDARDPSSPQAYASVTFSARVPLRESYTVTVKRLVDALLAK
jgi:uncharacterized protein YceK